MLLERWCLAFGRIAELTSCHSSIPDILGPPCSTLAARYTAAWGGQLPPVHLQLQCTSIAPCGRAWTPSLVRWLSAAVHSVQYVAAWS